MEKRLKVSDFLLFCFALVFVSISLVSVTSGALDRTTQQGGYRTKLLPCGEQAGGNRQKKVQGA